MTATLTAADKLAERLNHRRACIEESNRTLHVVTFPKGFIVLENSERGPWNISSGLVYLMKDAKAKTGARFNETSRLIVVPRAGSPLSQAEYFIEAVSLKLFGDAKAIKINRL